MQHFSSRPHLVRLDPNSRVPPQLQKKRPDPSHGGHEYRSLLSPRSPRPMEVEDGSRLTQGSQSNAYLPEIREYLRELEQKSGSREMGFLRWQTEVTEEMRAVLVDWLVAVHERFKLTGESLFLAVHILDRYLSMVQVGRDRLQLAGICSLLIASKIQDIFAPQIKDLVYLSDYSCTKAQVLEYEGRILAALAFDFSYSSPLHSLAVHAQAVGLQPKSATFARYLLELSLLSSAMSQFPTSCQAQAAVYIASKVFQLKRAEPEPAGRERACVERMFEQGLRERESRLQAVRRKFGQAHFHGVSELEMRID